MELGASEDGLVTELLLDSEKLVVLGESLGSRGSTSLDLAGSETDGKVSDGDILSLTGSVGDHDTPLGVVGVVGGLDGLGDGSDLVDLEQKGVGRLLLDGSLDSDGVGDGQIITDNLDVGGGDEVRPGGPVILSKGILERDNGVLGDELRVVRSKLLTGLPQRLVGVGVLEVKVVLVGLLVVELGRSGINGDLDLAGVTSGGNGLGDEVKSLLGSLNIGGNTTLVTDVAGGGTVLLLGELLELVVDLGSGSERLGEGGELGGSNHELLDSESASGVRTTVQNVKEGNGEHVGLGGRSQRGNVLVERDTLLTGTGSGSGDGDTKDGVGTELGLVLSSVEVEQELVEGSLVLDVELGLNQSGGNDLVDVLDGLEDTLSAPLGGILVSELESLVDTGGGTGGDDGSEETVLGGEVNLNGGVSWS